jgi:Flp pilus assembly protein TadG
MEHLLKFHRSCEGSSLVEFSLVFPLFLVMVAGAVDFGKAYGTAIDLSAAAQAGAHYGAQNPTDLHGMVVASQVGAPNLAGLTASATYGCECRDGSSAVAMCTTVPSCADNYVNYVDVTTTAPFTPIMALPGVFSPGTLRSESRMRVGGD